MIQLILLLFVFIIVIDGEEKKFIPIIIDVQKDFTIRSGALSVFGTQDKDDNQQNFIRDINQYIEKSVKDPKFGGIVFSIDFHPDNHCSFASKYGKKAVAFTEYSDTDCNPPEQVVWKDHCIVGQSGTDLHPSLKVPVHTNGEYTIVASDVETIRQTAANPNIERYQDYVEKQ